MTGRCGLACFIVTLPVCMGGCGGTQTTGSQTSEDPALESARTTAVTFLDALKNQDGSSAFGLLSKDYRERLSEEERNAKKMQVAVVEGKPIAEWNRKAGVLSDNKEQATFEDGVQLKDGKQYGYRLVLVKESGVWKVDLFTVKK